MKTNREKIIERFYQVKRIGWVKSHRANNTGIGKTFEDLVGVVENNIDEPDLFGFEIKSHREESASYTTLFTKAPSFPRGANAFLKDNFGTPYPENPTLNRLHTSMFATQPNTYAGKYSFQLINDKRNKQIRIAVFNLRTQKLLDDSVGYTYEALEKVLKKKLSDLFYVSAERRYKNGKEEFHFTNADIYAEPSFKQFLKLLDKGKIMFDIRIGSYQSGSNTGKAHDHGSGFRIKAEDLPLLYEYHESV
ncbi:MAG: MvaI/BcnI restriction endonuclease family protein [Paludibacteraceae bacterium]|nr:MvaI/BcnI restriction endonuclease family protein [Paludibacteraceae bacterium]